MNNKLNNGGRSAPQPPNLGGLKGRISLPLRPDPMNRPRQVVDMEHGKRAVTDYEVISDKEQVTGDKGHVLVALWPQTGRTHQLRVHCAHAEGLGRPIQGDNLYGRRADRLYLHAARIAFAHPTSGEEMVFERKPMW